MEPTVIQNTNNENTNKNQPINPSDSNTSSNNSGGSGSSGGNPRPPAGANRRFPQFSVIIQIFGSNWNPTGHLESIH